MDSSSSLPITYGMSRGNMFPGRMAVSGKRLGKETKQMPRTGIQIDDNDIYFVRIIL